MTFSEEDTRAYVQKRFPRASKDEQEHLVGDWAQKPAKAEGIAADFERRAAALAGLRILDAGSGNGGISIAFAKRGAHVEGVDIEPELVAIARAAAARVNAAARFTLYDGTALPFSDAAFDAAISISVVEHVTDPIRYFSEILRVLKPGGLLYLAFPNRLRPWETHTRLWGLSYMPRALARAYVKIAKRNPLEDNNLHFYSYWAMRRMLGAAACGGRAFSIVPERGTSANPLKRFVKTILRALGIPHQAFLPHVMLILAAEERARMAGTPA